VAVVTYFFRDLWAMARAILGSWRKLLRGELPDDPMGRLGLYLVVGCIPAAVAGLLFENAIDDAFHGDTISDGPLAVICLLLIGAGLLLGLADRATRRRRNRALESIGLREALIAGLAQALALLPGVSRSGSTITAGLLLGLDRATAARFSFLLGVPIIFGAGVVEMLDLFREGIPDGERDVFAAGVLTAMVVGYLTIAGLLRFLQRHSTDVFVIYRIALGVGVLALIVAGVRS
jgi:undecaprenyl-diphosphatase